MRISNEQLSLTANSIRCLAADMIEQAKSGHPGAALGLADVAASLWLKFLKFDAKDPTWPDRDRLIFSGGHASTLLYSLFYLAGVDNMKIDELKQFRQFGSRCAGHPERGVMPGVEVTTGPLGQGIAMGVGMALAERMEAARWNDKASAPSSETESEDAAEASPANVPLVNHRTWVLCGDGDLEEGISHEACSFAGKMQLDKLTLVYDSNNITIEGAADLAFADNTKLRFEAYGWKVYECDGHNLDAIDRTFRKALKVTGKPTLIIAHTHIGKGCPTKQDTAAVHGAPLGETELAGLKTALGFNPAISFEVPGDVYDFFDDRTAVCHRMNLRWKKALRDWTSAHPNEAEARDRAAHGLLPLGLEAKLPTFDPSATIATRNACGTVLTALAAEVPYLVGGSADLEPSNKTNLKPYAWLEPGKFEGRNIHWGVRELGMSAMVNGLVAHGGYRAFGATFAVFSDYCKPAMRLAALMGLPSMWIFSHDSFYVGEDGPTHEPVEQLAMLRTMPNLLTFRPADANETAGALLAMLQTRDKPSCILTSRQNLPVLEGVTPAKVAQGGYVIWEQGRTPELLFIATGSEVALCIEAAKRLFEAGRSVRVISMPCRELFEQQSLAYRESVLPSTCTKRVIVEAGVRFGWERYTVNFATTRFITLDRYGASAPYNKLAEEFGFTVDNVYTQARGLF